MLWKGGAVLRELGNDRKGMGVGVHVDDALTVNCEINEHMNGMKHVADEQVSSCWDLTNSQKNKSRIKKKLKRTIQSNSTLSYTVARTTPESSACIAPFRQHA